ncbi:glycosyltransferase family 4 protein [Corynebacterium choanae]|uniref:GDP-mannose-dependent alpha-(1-6)-phosphatidylinositol monomannoside mannosyltransferase n=1 Tax=Corynebacterium choanae TaxID=1862358 RepID=A0A3G6J7V1_9CORY|nr:glycosyltransferase family 4 protein [Corynebacterium choanae]AZA13969.1 GDP-mannose-dependent alpha-(1-6)-phosphatidylinositol monomannoside mannosyltransferase [Corynebacterium choanae]
MSRVLVVTNDFPPSVGGIQSYVRDYLATLPAHQVLVVASTQGGLAACRTYDAQLPYPVIRIPGYPLLPTPPVARALCRIVRQYHIRTVFFGAAAPLALLAPQLRQAGVEHIVAATHGHETGWAAIPGGRQLLRRIGDTVDVVGYIAEYTRQILQPAMGEHPRYVALPSGVDTTYFRPQPNAVVATMRSQFAGGVENPLVVCVSRLVRRKGQDQLVAAWPRVLQEFPQARLAIVGQGPDFARQLRLARAVGAAHGFSVQNVTSGQQHSDLTRIVFTGRLPGDGMRDLLAAADVAAVPCRTRLGGLDVEGLGIVYLEAQACGVPVIAGQSGGAPETVTPDTGFVVDGRNIDKIADRVNTLLQDPVAARHMGKAGRRHVQQQFSWQQLGARFAETLAIGAPEQ